MIHFFERVYFVDPLELDHDDGAVQRELSLLTPWAILESKDKFYIWACLDEKTFTEL